MKTFKNLTLSVVLVLTVLLLFGCGKATTEIAGETPSGSTSSTATVETEQPTGTWSTKINCVKMFGESFEQNLAQYEDYLAIKDLTVTLDFSFDADGTFRLELDADDMTDAIIDAAEAYMEDAAKKQNTTVEDALAEENMTLADFEESMRDQLAQSVQNAGVIGNWKAEDGKLFIFSGSTPNRDQYIVYEVLPTELKFTQIVGDDDSFTRAWSKMVPIALQKADR